MVLLETTTVCTLKLVQSSQLPDARGRDASAAGRDAPAAAGLERPWDRLDSALAAAIVPELPAIAAEIIDEIGRVVPDYRRPLEGAFGHNLRAGVQEALEQFLELISRPGPQAVALREVYVGLGRGELRSGRGLDALQSAYRVGARVAWRRMSSVAQRAGADAATVSLLAESMFDYIDEISAQSVEGYAQAQAEVAGEQQRFRQRLVRLLVSDDPPEAGLLAAAATSAAWPPPRVLAALVTRDEDVSRLTARLGAEVIGARVGELTCALVPDPDAPGRREQLFAALPDETAALGPPVALADTRRSFTLARDALALVDAGILPGGGPLAVEEHLVTLLLARGPSLIEELARRRLAPLLPLGTGSRERLQTTLAAWLREQGNVAAVAVALDVHPQTVRYRRARLRELFGPALEAPDARFELELVLRAPRPPGAAAAVG